MGSAVWWLCKWSLDHHRLFHFFGWSQMECEQWTSHALAPWLRWSGPRTFFMPNGKISLVVQLRWHHSRVGGQLRQPRNNEQHQHASLQSFNCRQLLPFAPNPYENAFQKASRCGCAQKAIEIQRRNVKHRGIHRRNFIPILDTWQAPKSCERRSSQKGHLVLRLSLLWFRSRKSYQKSKWRCHN